MIAGLIAIVLLGWTVLAVALGAVIGKGIRIAEEAAEQETLPIEGRETRWDIYA